MAETSKGGWVSRRRQVLGQHAARAPVSGTLSAASGVERGDDARPAPRRRAAAMARARPRQSLGLEVAGLAAGLVDEADVRDAHAAVHRLAHVVDRQGGDADGGQRLHLHAGRGRVTLQVASMSHGRCAP